MLSRTFLWPQGYTSAAMISVNLDAEFYGRIFYPGIDVSEGDIQRLGWTGMEYGLPHLLDCFREHGVKGTFFIPGRVAELYPDPVQHGCSLHPSAGGAAGASYLVDAV